MDELGSADVFLFGGFRLDRRGGVLFHLNQAGGAEPLDWPGGTVTWVDGGMLANFPITAFDRTQGAPRWPTIGIKLSAEPGQQLRDRPVRNAIAVAWRCLSAMKNEWDRYHIDQSSADRIIWVPISKNFKGTNFALSDDQQADLFRRGAEAATEFLIRWSKEGRVPRSDHQAS